LLRARVAASTLGTVSTAQVEHRGGRDVLLATEVGAPVAEVGTAQELFVEHDLQQVVHDAGDSALEAERDRAIVAKVHHSLAQRDVHLCRFLEARLQTVQSTLLKR
jgi:hypothetical protein